MPFSVLIGKRITGVSISDNSEYLLINADGGNYWFYTSGDCCSHSWIEHIDGVPALIGHVVTESRPVAYISGHRDNDDDHIQLYSIKIITDAGVCDIEFRNSSNGWYGGDMTYLDGEDPTAIHMNTLTHDYMRGSKQSNKIDRGAF